ncbi:MAG: DMT family transporter [Melioribacteraceae bacterium]|nr:DMT family transporter [Melioribacteraceae bacterium]MCF8263737.1 DMT family transporter [Melioribacteraceae bacterium]MCF8412683.1 DMT family transporter [Melioribacteraceae bacterium]MCF8430971.1 DMT family transporter [Melioribacteraceae bacterium]
MRLAFKPLAAITLWGISFIATKLALDELAPTAIIYLRLGFGALTLALIALYTKRKFTIKGNDLLGIFVLSLIAILHLTIQVIGINFTSASNTGWIIGLSPIFMVFLGILFFKEKINFIQSIGILIALIGLLLLVGKGDITAIDLIKNKGDLLVLGSAFTWAVYSFAGKKVTLNYPPLMTILYQFLMMVVLLSPFVINAENIIAVKTLSYNGWAAILFLGIFCSGIAYVFWASAMKQMNSTRVGAFLYLEPFVTVVAAWLILSEQVTLIMILSGIAILLGVYLVNRKSNS